MPAGLPVELVFDVTTAPDTSDSELAAALGNGMVGSDEGTAAGGLTGNHLQALSPGSISFGDEIGSSFCGPAFPNSTGVPAAMSAVGSAALSDNDVTLTAIGLPPGQFGYFLVSQTQGILNPPGSQESHFARASYMRCAMPARSKISPSRMNIGMATRMNVLPVCQKLSPTAGMMRC